jgi:probable F420-dependent oxidoreductase
VKIGLMTTPWESPTDMMRIAQLAEDRGFESIWVGEHSHFPVDSRHPFTKRTPEFYRRVPDPYVVLAAIASTTKSIRLGTGISLPAEHNPLTLAKSLATLDQAADGRLEWGVGYGWNQLEMTNRGLDPRHRMATFREVVLAVKALWTQDVAAYNGEHVRFSESWSWPKPVQRPHPPILLGCRAGKRAFGQLAEFCDGWMPSVTQALSSIDEDLRRLREVWASAGRDPAQLRLSFMDTGFFADVDVQRYRDEVRITPRVLERLREIGADRVIVDMPLFRLRDVEPMLDEVAELLDETT